MLTSIENLLSNNPIYKLLRFIDIIFDYILTTILFQYLSLQVIFALIIIIIQIIIFFLQYKIVSIIYFSLIKKDNLFIITFISEIYYYIDKFLYKISPSIIDVSSLLFFRVRDLSLNNISIINLFNKIKKVFKPSFYNFMICFIIFFYYQNTFLSGLSIDYVNSFFKGFNIDLKLLNALSTLVLLLISFLIIFLFRSSFIQSKAKRKVYDTMHEKIIEQQMVLSTNLIPILYKSNKNFELINRQLDYIVSNYCEELSGGLYTWRANKLEKEKNYYFPSSLDKNSIFYQYEDFTEEIKKINESFNIFDTYRFQSIYYITNKKIRYEFLNLSLYPPKLNSEELNNYFSLEHRFLNKRYIEDLYNNRIKNNSSLQYYLKNYHTLTSFETETFERLIVEDVTLFKDILKQDYKESVYYRIVGSQYVNKLEKKNQLKIKDWLITK